MGLFLSRLRRRELVAHRSNRLRGCISVCQARAEGSSEEVVEFFVFHHPELPQRGHINNPPGEFAHGQEFIDVVQHLCLTGFLRIGLGERVSILQLVLTPDFFWTDIRFLGDVRDGRKPVRRPG